ncbi:MAG: hypothetical protein AAFY73_05990 [Pseudomonadota bacterium]
MKVLLIDDDPIEHKLFEAYFVGLEEPKHELVAVPTLREGLCQLDQAGFGAVFLDNRLSSGERYGETLPNIIQTAQGTRIYLISACTSGLRKVSREFPGVEVLNKFDIKAALEAGLLDRSTHGANAQTSAVRPPAIA